MTTMEEIIDMEAKEIIRLCNAEFQDVQERLDDIERRAKNIRQTLEEGDPK